MADSTSKKRKIKTSPETVRERAQKVADTPVKKRRVKQTVKSVGKPFKAATKMGAKEYYLPLPDTRLGRFLNRRRSLIPRYFRESWKELRLVTWPNRKETTKLTLAVFAFAIIFGLLVSVVDFGLDRLFKEALLN